MAKPKVLYVEDEEMYQTLVRQILTEEGYAVEVAGTGAEAGRKLDHFKPDLLILDINLPDTDGYTLCQGLRREERWATLPILMLTVRRHPEEWRQGFSAGASDYVSKPLNGPDLLERVGSCLDGKTAPLGSSDNPEVLMVQSARAGNRGAFEVFLRQYKEELYKLIRRHSSNDFDAEELVSLAFTQAYEHLGQFRGECPFFMWLYSIARNELRHKRRQRHEASLEELTQDEDDDDLSASEMLCDRSSPKDAEILFQADLEKIMSEIPDEFRPAMQMHLMQGLPYDMIADTLDVPVGTVMSRLSRGRAHLRKIWHSLHSGGRATSD